MNNILLYIVTAFTFVNAAILVYVIIKIRRLKKNVIKLDDFKPTILDNLGKDGQVISMPLVDCCKRNIPTQNVWKRFFDFCICIHLFPVAGFVVGFVATKILLIG